MGGSGGIKEAHGSEKLKEINMEKKKKVNDFFFSLPLCKCKNNIMVPFQVQHSSAKLLLFYFSKFI